ncbi:MAG: hypothetical protein KGN84_05140 [Acidobacteriota bacterium]|nr:hypothetical protein [Acidobacteriota bacterium]
MMPIEEYVKNADALAQEVLDDWARNFAAGTDVFLSEDYKDDYLSLRNKALQYWEAKSETTQQMFAEAYKKYRERRIS